MFVRTTKYIAINPDRVQATLDDVSDRMLPELEREYGLIDGFVLVNHRSGQIMGVTLWESELAMQAAANKEAGNRDRVTIDWRSEPQVDTWEVALSHNDILERGRAAIAEAVTGAPVHV